MDSTYSTVYDSSVSIYPDTRIKKTLSERSSLIFRQLTLDDMPLVWTYLKQAKGRTTDFSFGGIAMWMNYFKSEFCIYSDTLFIKRVMENDRDVTAFSVPVGKLPLADAVEILSDYCRDAKIKLRFSAVPEDYAGELSDIGATGIEGIPHREDYLYHAEKLATLSGRKMAKKRNHVNRFRNIYEGRWEYEGLTECNCAEAYAFMDIIDLEGDDSPQAVEERVLARRILRNFPQLASYMAGGILRVDGKVCAITVGDVKSDTLFVHIEKATRRIDGSYEMINYLFAKSMCAANNAIKYINREDDAGDEGLRMAKQSYHPAAMLRKYNISF